MLDLSNIFNKDIKKAILSKEQLAEMLKVTPEALEAFERSYQLHSMNDSTISDNLFKVNAKQAAGMNPNETKELMETIRFVRDKFDMTVLLIEHDMKLVSGICEELTVLNFGQVLAQGKTGDVLNNPEVIKAYLGE